MLQDTTTCRVISDPHFFSLLSYSIETDPRPTIPDIEYERPRDAGEELRYQHYYEVMND
jgi:hypothetical protein